MHRMANEEALKCLKEDGTFTKKDLNFKRDLFLMYYADYFYYYLFNQQINGRCEKNIIRVISKGIFQRIRSTDT